MGNGSEGAALATSQMFRLTLSGASPLGHINHKDEGIPNQQVWSALRQPLCIAQATFYDRISGGHGTQGPRHNGVITQGRPVRGATGSTTLGTLPHLLEPDLQARDYLARPVWVGEVCGALELGKQ